MCACSTVPAPAGRHTGLFKMNIVGVGAIVALLLPIFGVSAQETVDSKWAADEQVSPLDGRRVVTRSIMSSNTFMQRSGRQAQAMLLLRCADQKVVAFLALPGADIRNDPIPVLWRVGEAALNSERWEALGRGSSTAYIEESDALLEAIAAEGVLFARVANAYEVTFRIEGGAEAVSAVRSACD